MLFRSLNIAQLRMVTPMTAHQQSVPFITVEKFSESSGLPIGVVQAWVDRKLIPSLKVGKRRVINLALLTEQCLNDLLTLDHKWMN